MSCLPLGDDRGDDHSLLLALGLVRLASVLALLDDVTLDVV